MLIRARLKLPPLQRSWRHPGASTRRLQHLNHYSPKPPQDSPSSPPAPPNPWSHLRHRLTSRPPTYTPDIPTPIPTNLLHKTLHDFLPPAYHTALYNLRASSTCLPPGYHLLHFPPSDPLSHLQSDGTDPAHSPGPPFNRRMWASGYMHFHRDLVFDYRSRELAEKIVDVDVKGRDGEEKVFVGLRREVRDECSAALIVEGRTLVFMHDPLAVAVTGVVKQRVVKPPEGAEFAHTLTPTAGLLFRFSALTFNAHRIHIDREYCREVEGYRNLLVHGPLSVVLMLDMLQGYLGESGGRITEIEYRNLAPLYAEEAMRVCGKRKGEGEGQYEVWIEGVEGGLAVRGTVRTETPDEAVQKWRSNAR